MVWQGGRTLNHNKYTIEKPLGSGRHCQTYLARDRSGCRVAIKTLNQERLESEIQAGNLTPDYRVRLEAQFLQEAEKLEMFREHPHILNVIDKFVEKEASVEVRCIVTEYIPGDTLDRLVKRVLPEKEALRYIYQIGDALCALHAKNWFHRDIKPANIMIRAGEYEAVLIDFELVRTFDYPHTRKLTVDGFSPIELYGNRERGAFTDVYSLAAVLYAILTGEVPPKADDRKDKDVSLVPPKELNPAISDRVNTAILKGMKLEPGDRPQTMSEWLRSLGWRRRLPVPFPKWDAMTTATVIIAVFTAILGMLGAIDLGMKLKDESRSPDETPVKIIPEPETNE